MGSKAEIDGKSFSLQAILTEYKTTDRMSRQSKDDKAGQLRKADFKSHMPVQTIPSLKHQIGRPFY
jgi:hypothetical protein